MAGQTCRFAPISPPASAAMPAEPWECARKNIAPLVLVEVWAARQRRPTLVVVVSSCAPAWRAHLNLRCALITACTRCMWTSPRPSSSPSPAKENYTNSQRQSVQWAGRRCLLAIYRSCAAGDDGRAATRPYRLGNVPIIIGNWYYGHATRPGHYFAVPW